MFKKENGKTILKFGKGDIGIKADKRKAIIFEKLSESYEIGSDISEKNVQTTDVAYLSLETQEKAIGFIKMLNEIAIGRCDEFTFSVLKFDFTEANIESVYTLFKVIKIMLHICY